MTRRFLLIAEDAVVLVSSPCPAGGGEQTWPAPSTRKPISAAPRKITREGNSEEKDARKSNRRRCPTCNGFSRPCDPIRITATATIAMTAGFARKNGGYQGDSAVSRINETERPEHKHRRNDKESAGDDA